MFGVAGEKAQETLIINTASEIVKSLVNMEEENRIIVCRHIYDLAAISQRRLSAEELKGFISRCRVFIGARTHSTIAAYSSCVPTLVLGYSVKSVNIALDLFGKTDGFVVPVDALEDADGLTRAFERMLQTEQLHRQILRERVPAYVKKAGEAAQTLRDFLTES